MPKIIAVANQKAESVKRRALLILLPPLPLPKRVLLVDADPQANATSGAGVQRGSFRRSLYHALILDEPLSNVIQNTELPLMKVLPADKNLAELK
jgi:chromosome partitioning protein